MKASTSNLIAASSALALIVLFTNAQALAQGCPAPSFAAAVSYETGNGCWSVAVGDFNGDGKSDLTAANRYARNLSVLLGNGDGTFQTAVSYGAGSSYESVAVGDFNADGKADLAVGNGSFGNISVLLGAGDGKPELAVANQRVAPIRPDVVSVLLNKGDGTFQNAVDYGAGTGPHSVAVGDFNGDGVSDLVVANEGSNDVSVLLGNGDGTFRPAISHGVGESPQSVAIPRSVAVGDFNGDGKPDLAVANERSGGISVLLNTCVAGGISLAVERGNDGLTLSWPLFYTNLVLESAASFSLPNWQHINGEMTANNGRWKLLVPMDQAQRYFRLRGQ